jgi:hypothetical protein
VQRAQPQGSMHPAGNRFKSLAQASSFATVYAAKQKWAQRFTFSFLCIIGDQMQNVHFVDKMQNVKFFIFPDWSIGQYRKI